MTVVGRPVRLTFDSRVVVVAVSGSGYAAMIANTPAEAAAMQTGVAVAFHLGGIAKTGAAIFAFPDDLESEEFRSAPSKLRNTMIEHVNETVRRNLEAIAQAH